MLDRVEPPAGVPPSLPLRVWRLCVRWRFALGLAAVATVFALSSIPNYRRPRVHGLDKVEHVAEYFLLTLVFLNVTTRGFSRGRLGAVLGAGLAAIGLAVLDETYQRFVPRRAFDLWDVVFSSVGVLAALASVLILRRIAPVLTRRRP